ncbi:hypothetical protein B0T20DRAFT_254424 [Sordaria brevicollis]|uniref:Uncharacterized protein n=1 Tax=Sordaria brevicollis TaxID=83679 RepID=A0AAE0PCC0_SORBR|nr:hypothetical protein B0T20DRAFT_254424 [Sordaria brevicollis]
MCTKHFIDSYCTSCKELVQGRSREEPCKPKYRGVRLGQCAKGIETKTDTESVICKVCDRKQRKTDKKKGKEKAKAEKEKEREKKKKQNAGELTNVDEEEQPLTST